MILDPGLSGGACGEVGREQVEEAPVGKVLPTGLTPSGRRSLEKATVAVRSVELRMLAGMTETEQSGAFRILQSMIHSLRDGH
jgi:hypothetical protein